VQGPYLYLNVGGNWYTYAQPPNKLAGNRTLNIKEMEVYQVVSTPSAPSVTNSKTKKSGGKNKADNKESAAANDTVSNKHKQVQNFSFAINLAINKKWATLAEAEEDLSALETSFNEEEKLITFFERKNDFDFIALNVCGTPMATSCQTVQVHEDSTLASKILHHEQDKNSSNQKPIQEWNTEDVVAWLNSVDGLSSPIIKSFEEDKVNGRELLSLGKEGLKDFGITRRGTVFYLLSEIEKLQTARGSAAVLIEHSPYCFEKIIDHLRLESMFLKGLIKSKPSLPIVKASEKSRFEKVVKHYFPCKGSDSFV
jgi:hypothetical protein